MLIAIKNIVESYAIYAKRNSLKTIQSPYEIELIDTKSDWIIFIGILLVICCISLGYEYYRYKSLLSHKNVNLHTKVLLQYKKPNKNYYVLKLKNDDGAIFYTTSRDDLKDLRGRFINVYGKLSDDCSFYQYLRSCFVISFTISLTSKKDYRSGVLEYIDSQHNAKYIDYSDEFETNLASSLYKNIFLATPMESKLRNMSTALGIAHIFAISGFHLGILTLVLYIILSPPYRALQKRYFTYRNEFYDINFILMIFAFLYLIVLDFTPSFLRSFVMFAFGIFVLWRGVKLVSFKLLLACVLIILSLFPRIFFSIGFWLSVSGVFYIYLYLKNAPKMPRWLYIIALNFIIFFNMLIIAHYFFYTFSAYQLFSPFITLGFVIFYPLMLLLHIVGFGGGLDSVLFAVMNYDFHTVELKTPLWLLIGYIMVSFIAIFKKFAYYFIVIISTLYCLYGVLLTLKDFL